MNVREMHAELVDRAGERVYGSLAEAMAVAAACINQCFTVLTAGGKVGFAEWPEEPEHPAEGSLQLNLSKNEDMAALLGNAIFQYREGEEIKRKSAFVLWRMAQGRRTHYGIEFALDTTPGYLNLWFGHGVEPQAGDWSLFRRLLVEGICSNEPDPEAAAAELLKMIAWKLQNMDQLPEKALVLRGGKGTGKNTFFNVLRKVMGSAYAVIYTNREHVFGRFNAHLAHRALVGLNEAFWRGDHREDASLKGMITDQELPVEIKFGPALMVRNIMLLILMANADWVVPATDDERRYAVYDVADTFKQDLTFFAEMYAQMEQGGYAGLLHDMLAMDLDGWHPRQMTATAGLHRQRRRSMPAVASWLVALVRDPEAASEISRGGSRYLGESVTSLSPFPEHMAWDAEEPTAGRWSWWNRNALVLGTAADIEGAFRRWAEKHGGVPRDMTQDSWVIEQLKQVFGDNAERDLFWKPGKSGKKRVRAVGGPQHVWCIAARGEIEAYLEAKYPGVFDDGEWADPDDQEAQVAA